MRKYKNFFVYIKINKKLKNKKEWKLKMKKIQKENIEFTKQKSTFKN